MKKSILILCICIIGCSKSNNNNPSPGGMPGSIQYKVDGNLVTIDNKNIASGQYVVFAKQLKGIVPQTRYLLNAQKGANNFFSTEIVTDSLSITNYGYDSTYAADNYGIFLLNMYYNGNASTLYSTNDFFNIKITSYKSSQVSGTFTARLTPIINSGFGATPVNITDGSFTDVPVTY